MGWDTEKHESWETKTEAEKYSFLVEKNTGAGRSRARLASRREGGAQKKETITIIIIRSN